MGLEAATYFDDLNTSNPAAGDNFSQGDDHLRLIKGTIKSTLPGLAGRAWRVQSKAVNYTGIATDNMSVLQSSAAITLPLTAAATLGNGWMVEVDAVGGDITIDPNAAETVNGATTVIVPKYSRGVLFCDGSAFYFFGRTGTTFTPTVTIGGSSVGVTYSNQIGRYRLKDDLVFVTGRVTITSKGGLTGAVLIGGMPFTSLNVSGLYQPLACSVGGISSGVVQTWSLLLLANSTTLQPSFGSAGTLAAAADTDIGATFDCLFNGTYIRN